MFTVLKPFPHETRRFPVGATVTEADLDGSKIPLSELKSRKFIAGAETKAAEAAAEKAEVAATETEPSEADPAPVRRKA